jgi:hypothetical protein
MFKTKADELFDKENTFEKKLCEIQAEFCREVKQKKRFKFDLGEVNLGNDRLIYNSQCELVKCGQGLFFVFTDLRGLPNNKFMEKETALKFAQWIIEMFGDQKEK